MNVIMLHVSMDSMYVGVFRAYTLRSRRGEVCGEILVAP